MALAQDAMDTFTMSRALVWTDTHAAVLCVPSTLALAEPVIAHTVTGAFVWTRLDLACLTLAPWRTEALPILTHTDPRAVALASQHGAREACPSLVTVTSPVGQTLSMLVTRLGASELATVDAAVRLKALTFAFDALAAVIALVGT